ncbi:MAG: hypothetical protein AMXMBFR61_07300 [Fimbriimonadales bacterium]
MIRGMLIAALCLSACAFAQKLTSSEQRLYDAAVEAQRAGDFPTAITQYRKLLHARESYVPAHLNLASAYVANGEADKSVYHLRRAAALQPENGQVWLKIAAVHAQALRVKDAEQALARVPKDLRSTSGYLYVRAVIEIGRNDMKGALADLQAAHRKSPDDVEVLFLLASVQLHLGMRDEAIELLSKAGQRNPREPVIWQALAEAHFAGGDTAAGTAALEKAHALMPENIEVAVLLARLYEQSERFEDAVQLLAKMIRTYPRNRLLRIEQGDVFARRQMWAEAEAQYLVARELSPRNPEVENRLATVAVKLGRTEQAKEQFEAVLLVDPKNTGAYLGLEELYLKAQAHGPLIRLYRKWMENVPQDPYPSRQVCEIYRQGRDDAATVREYRRHLEAFPNDVEGLRAFALFSEARKDYETALSQLRRLTAIDPQDRAAQVSIGEVLIKAGKTEEALAHLRSLAEKNPQDPAPWLSLGAYYESTDQLDKAKAVYEESLGHKRTEIVLAQLVRLLERMGDVDGAVKYAWDLLSTSKNPSADFPQIPNLLYRNGRKEEAKKAWVERVAAQPNDTLLRSGYGVFLMSDGDLDGAAAQFAEIKRLEPRNSYPRMRLAEIYEQQKKMDAWIAEVRGLLDIAPDELGGYALLSRYYAAREDNLGFWNELLPRARKGSPEDVAVQRLADFAPTVGKQAEALDVAKSRVDAAPLSRGAWLALAKAHANLEQWREAIDAYARASRMDPTNIAAVRAYCLLAEERGTPQQALDAFKLYAENHPNDSWAMLKYANLLRENGKPLEALDAYRKVLERFPDNETALQAVKEIEEQRTRPGDSRG